MKFNGYRGRKETDIGSKDAGARTAVVIFRNKCCNLPRSRTKPSSMLFQKQSRGLFWQKNERALMAGEERQTKGPSRTCLRHEE